MLHITDGASVAGSLRESGLPGRVAVYGDLLYEGPVPAGRDGSAFRQVRANFLAAAGYTSLPEALEQLLAWDNALLSAAEEDEVVLWLDNKLSNQLMLIRILAWFHRLNLPKLTLSSIGDTELLRLPDFRGLGALSPGQLAALLPARQPVRPAQLETGHAAWLAFSSPDPTQIERLLAAGTSALPFLSAALRRHLEQFPSVGNGLSRTEREALLALHTRGPLADHALFLAVQRTEPIPFLGDWSFYRLMADLALAPHPLLTLSHHTRDSLGSLAITSLGRQVITGLADHVERNGVDRWLGGVHLRGPQSAWRWNPSSAGLLQQA